MSKKLYKYDDYEGKVSLITYDVTETLGPKRDDAVFFQREGCAGDYLLRFQLKDSGMFFSKVAARTWYWDRIVKRMDDLSDKLEACEDLLEQLHYLND